jgi:hypothetical protein
MLFSCLSSPFVLKKPHLLGMEIDKKEFCPSYTPEDDLELMIGRSPGLTSSYFAPSRFRSGISHFVSITVAGTAFESYKIPCYVLRTPIASI